MQWEHSPALYNDVLGNDGLPVWQWSIRILMDYKWVCLNCSKEKLLCLSLSLHLCLSVSTNSLPSAFLSFLSIFFLPLSHPQSEDPVWMKQPEIQKRSHQPWLVWLSWLVCHSVHQKVGGLIPDQGTHLCCGFNKWGTCGRQLIDVSLSL